MTTATEVYECLTQHGVVLRVQDGQLKARATQGMLTEAWRHEIRTHREALMALLTSTGSPMPQALPARPHAAPSLHAATQAPCVVCGGSQRWDDAGVWRCTTCWPTPLTVTTRQAAQRYQASCRPPKAKES